MFFIQKGSVSGSSLNLASDCIVGFPAFFIHTKVSSLIGYHTRLVTRGTRVRFPFSAHMFFIQKGSVSGSSLQLACDYIVGFPAFFIHTKIYWDESLPVAIAHAH